MRPRRTHYEILGVARSSPPEEIKRQYRRLAKRYHPDVAATTDTAAAHRAFVRLTEAYETLIDPGRRESYDRQLALQEERQARASPAAAPQAQGQGAARSAAAPRPPPRPDLAQMLFNARMDFGRGRMQTARSICEEIIRLDRRQAGAYSLLGDIHRTQGGADEAIKMYTIAVQLDPSLTDDIAKLERLARQRPAGDDDARQEPLPGSLRAISALGWGLVVGLFALPVAYRGSPLVEGAPILGVWTDNLLLAMVGCSLLTGFLITITRVIGRLDDTFLLSTVRTGGGPLAVGWIMLAASALFFPLAVAFYAIIAVMEEAGSRAVTWVVGLSAAGVALFALGVPAAARETLLFGGNVIFLCMVLGSFVGGFFREPW